MSQVTARVLPPAEYGILQQIGGPLREGIPQDAGAVVTVVEVNGEPKGYWVLFDAAHAEPLYLDVEARDNPAVARVLLERVFTELQDRGVQSVFAIIGDDVEPVVGPMAERLGLYPLPGKIYGGLIMSKG